MTDLNERFRTLDRLAPPDLWDDAERRRPGTRLLGSRRHRLITAAVALVVAAAGIGLAATTFDGSRQRDTSDVVGFPLENGVIAYVSNGEIWLVQADGSEAARVEIDAPGLVGGPAWSPDGRRLAFDVNSYPPEGAPKGGYDDVYVANADGSDVVRLTYERGARLPAWSPDSSRIAYASQQPDGGSQIFAMDADGSDPNQLTSGPAFNMRPAWSPDGASIAFESVFDRNSDVYVMSADGSDPHRLTNDLAWDGDPVWSPDGDHIVFVSDRDPSGIYMMNADGSDVRLIEPDDDVANPNIAWAPDGRFLAFTSSRGPGFGRAIYVLELSSGVVIQITDRGPLWGPAWQPVLGDEGVSPLPSPGEPTVAIPPSTAEVVDTFAVGEDVRSVAYGEGSVWVAASNNDGTLGGWIIRIDQQTHEVQAEIPVEVIPTWVVGGGAMAFEDKDLWVVGDLERPGAFDDPGGGADAAVIRIDASTNEVVQTISVGGAGGADLAFLDGELWVLLFGDGSVDHVTEVVQVDRVNGQVLARIPLTASWAHTIVAADGRLVVIEGGSQAVNVGAHVTVIDPVTATMLGTETRSGVEGPVVSAGGVWAATDEGFARIDPVTGTLVERSPSLDPSRYAICCGFIEADDRGIWFIAFNGRTGSGEPRLDLFNPESGEVSELVTLGEGTPVAMAVSPDAVWILNYEGTLTHVDLG